MKTRVLVTGASGPAALAFMKAAASRRLDFCAADADPYAAGLYLVPEERRALLPVPTESNFSETLLRVCKRLGVEVLVPTADAELIPVAIEREQFEAAGIKLLLAPLSASVAAQDRFELMRTCRDVVPVPQTRLFDARFEPTDDEFPLVLKARRLSRGRPARLVRDRRGLEREARGTHLVAQELLGGAEYAVDVLVGPAGLVAAVPRVQLRTEEGESVTSATVQDEELQEMAKRVALRLGMEGIGTVTFRRDDQGTPKLTGFVPRVSSAMMLTVQSGVNMPRIWLKSVLDGTPMPQGPMPFSLVAMVRLFENHEVDPSQIEQMERAAAAALAASEAAE
jgi:carbamoyl-phosphate synthase large subunit